MRQDLNLRPLRPERSESKKEQKREVKKTLKIRAKMKKEKEKRKGKRKTFVRHSPSKVCQKKERR